MHHIHTFPLCRVESSLYLLGTFFHFHPLLPLLSSHSVCCTPSLTELKCSFFLLLRHLFTHCSYQSILPFHPLHAYPSPVSPSLSLFPSLPSCCMAVLPFLLCIPLCDVPLPLQPFTSPIPSILFSLPVPSVGSKRPPPSHMQMRLG